MIGVLLLTYNRTDYAIRTIRALKENWIAPDYRIYIADGGSKEDHVNILKEECGNKFVGLHTCDYSGVHIPCGLNWKIGIENIFSKFDIIIHLEDDQVLERPFDATEYINILETEETVGIIRLGPVVTGLTGQTVGVGNSRFLEMDLKSPFSFSCHPHLKHKRFHKFYGNFPEEINSAGETERTFETSVRDNHLPGPKIWIPFDLCGQGLFGHIGKDKTQDIILANGESL